MIFCASISKWLFIVWDGPYHTPLSHQIFTQLIFLSLHTGNSDLLLMFFVTTCVEMVHRAILRFLDLYMLSNSNLILRGGTRHFENEGCQLGILRKRGCFLFTPFLSILHIIMTNFPIKWRGANPLHPPESPLIRVLNGE